MAKIIVHEKALAHLSRGLYRSPASAIRELVSNAWDANATTVRINTNYPNFLMLSVEDDGDGFTKDEFEALMGGGIGNSQKRPQAKVLLHGRPIIGRLGIGMLGVAQICSSFTVTSQPSKGAGFRARVTIRDLLKEELDRPQTPLITKENGKTASVDVGEYVFEKFEPSSIRRGTRIIADDLHPTFIKSFKDSLKLERYRRPPSEWKRVLQFLKGIRSLQELGDYWRLLWELAVTSPVPYVDERALPQSLIVAEQHRLESFKFKLIVDGIELRKPVKFSGNEGGYSVWPIEPQGEQVYAKMLRFHGYLLVQEGSQIKPDELRGIVLRVKDVGIGYYDQTLLDYRYNEGPRSRWVTGEIFVDEGLEDAMNIDRDSFNRFDPHFRFVQSYVHEYLKEQVFPATWEKIDERSKARSDKKSNAQMRHLKTVFEKRGGKPVEVQRARATASSRPDQRVEVKVSPTGRVVRVDLPAKMQTKRANQQLAASVIAIFEVALAEKGKDKQREAFTTLLLDLLEKW